LNSVTNAAPRGQARGGAIVALPNARPNVVNNTFLQNSASLSNGATSSDLGGAIAFIGSSSTNTSQALLANNLIAYNSTGLYASGRYPDVRNNLVYGSFKVNYAGIGDQTGLSGNLSVAPRLAGPYGDAHLTQDSPARDAGDSSVVGSDWVDIDGLRRISGSGVDIGADEFDGTIIQIAKRVFYVRPDGNDANAGTTWAAAKRTLENALASAAFEGGEVWVQAGTYSERVRVEMFTYLIGGFKGDEATQDARNWATNPTIVDGGADRDNPVPEDPVVSVSGTDGYASVDGLTIQNGSARFGAGLNVFGSAYIANNLVRSNIGITSVTNASPAGAGLYCNVGSPVIVNNVFAGNTVRQSAGTFGRGGGIYLDVPLGQTPRIINNTIVNNRSAGEGGGVYMTSTTVADVVGNIIAFNSTGITAMNTTNIALANCSYGNTGNNYNGIQVGQGTVVGDPLLVDWRNGNFRLRSDSPCINAGVVTDVTGSLDFYAGTRVIDGVPDIGADEFSGPVAADFDLTLVQPLNGSVSVAPATVFAAVSISGGSTLPVYVEYLIDGVVAATGGPDAYSSFAQNVLAGEHAVVARAVTAAGAIRSSAPVTINVLIPPNNIRPNLTFNSPTNGQILPAGIDLNVKFSWTKPGGRVIRWDLYTNSVLAAQALTIPNGTTNGTATVNDLTTGDYRLTVIATDNVGDKGTNSVNFTVTRADPSGSTISSPVLVGNGTIQLEFTAPTAGALYITESSVDYSKWTPISTNLGGANVKLILPVDPAKKLEVFRTRAGF